MSDGSASGEPTVSYRRFAGTVNRVDLAAAQTQELAVASPWRQSRAYLGQTHYSGLYWSATTAAHVAYENRLELSRLILADFDPSTVGIVAQPFLVEAGQRRHVPDFLLLGADGLVTVLDVKSPARLKKPEVSDTLAWAAGLFASRGWRSEVWSGADPVVMANVRFLAGYRRHWLVDAALVDVILTAVSDGRSIADVEQRAAPHPTTETRPVLLSLLWRGLLVADLSKPLDTDTRVARAA